MLAEVRHEYGAADSKSVTEPRPSGSGLYDELRLAETVATTLGAAPVRAQILEIDENDLPAIEAFIRSQRSASPAALDVSTEKSKLAWFLVENPARRPGIPLGWQLRSTTGELCGVMLCSPQDFCIGGRNFTLLLSSDFYVTEPNRGAGLAILLRYLQMGLRYPLFAVTANRQSGSLWQKFGGQAMPGTDHEMIGVWNVCPMVEEILWRTPAVRVIARAAAAVASPLAQAFYDFKETNDGGQLIRLNHAEEVLDLHIPPDPVHLCAALNLNYIRWRYFTPEARTEAYRYRLPVSKHDYFVAVKIARRGHRGQFRALTVLNVQPKPGARTLLSLASCLAKLYRKSADGIIFRCLAPEDQKALARTGFRRRALEGSSAWWIDKRGHLPNAPWYVVPADGDMLL